MLQECLCQKTSKGFLKYEVETEKGWLRLVKDYPAKGKKGAVFSQNECISFNSINKVLSSSTSLKTNEFSSCFNGQSSNNSPMLVAALEHYGVLKKIKRGYYTPIKKL